jgi:hypothetical protein
MITLGNVNIEEKDYATQATGILGLRGSGKTHTGMWIAEKLMDANVPIIAFDPIDIWKSLKVPGQGKGYPIVVAGNNGDILIPDTEEGIRELILNVMQNNISLVINLYDANLSKDDWKKIVAVSVKTLLYENKSYGLRHIFFEEAAEIAPQTISLGGDAYIEVEKLARLGRNANLGYTLINQRAEQVNKAILELCDNLFLHRQKGKNSIAALRRWLDVAGIDKTKEIIKLIPLLSKGDCWLWPSGSDEPNLVHIPLKNSFVPNGQQIGSFVGVPVTDKNVTDFINKINNPPITQVVNNNNEITMDTLFPNNKEDILKLPLAEQGWMILQAYKEKL